MHPAFLALKPHDAAVRRGGVVSTVGLNLLVAAAYAVSGFAGLKLAFIGGVVTLFWPPSGLAFAAVWLGGTRLLPGIALGALVVNFTGFDQPAIAALVALGNSLPALVGVTVLKRMVRRRGDDSELWRVLGFILVGVLASTTLSATVGTVAVALSGKVGGVSESAWLVWWMGDAMGVLIIAPPILLWRRLVAWGVSVRGIRDAAGFAGAGLAIIAGLLLIRDPIWAVELCKLFTLLLSLGAGARFGLGGPAAMTVLMAVGAVGVTAAGVGPFKRGNFYDNFTLVHSYLFAEAVAGMLLAAALADLRRSLQAETAARGEAENAAASRIRLLTMISHDVRTPLGGMTGVLQTLQAEPSAPERQRLVGLALRAARTLTTLVNDILDVARADSGRIVLEPSDFDLAQSLQDLVEFGGPDAAAKGLALELGVDEPAPPRLRGDRARVEQLFGNLIANAISFTPRGRVQVRLSYRADDPQPVRVEIVDTGPGIDAGAAAQMFDASVLAPRPGNRSAGLGLGLHISRSLAQLMGGSIAYRRGSDGGSVFTVRLPLAPAAPADAPPLRPARADPSLRILLVEDDVIAREVTAALLTSRGHRLAAVADAQAAIATASSERFDLVLMDIELDDQGASGLDATRRIRALARTGGALEIIALTGDASDGARTAYRAAGIDGLLLKPIRLDEGLAHAVALARWADAPDGAPLHRG